MEDDSNDMEYDGIDMGYLVTLAMPYSPASTPPWDPRRSSATKRSRTRVVTPTAPSPRCTPGRGFHSSAFQLNMSSF